MISFRSKLLLIFVALLFLVLASITWAVFNAASSAAVTYANNELDVAERVFNKLLLENRRQLIERASLLADDYGFRQAVATNEEETLISVLANHGDRIGASMVFITDSAGKLRLGSHDLAVAKNLIATNVSKAEQPFSLLLAVEQQAFQLAMVPVRAPNLIGWVGLGFAIDAELLNNLESVSKANITLLLDNADQPVLTTLAIAELAGLTREPEVSAPRDGGVLTSLLSRQGWLSRPVLLEGDIAGDIEFLLSVSATQLQEKLNKLQKHIVSIGVVALCLMLLAIVTIANSISRPITSLARSANRMALGDYSKPVTVKSKDEFGVLANSLNGMQTAIKDREEKISYQAGHDIETGLANRERSKRELEKLLSGKHSFVVMLLKISNLSRLNDLYGLSFVQQFIPDIAQRLLVAVGLQGFASRTGNNQFLLTLDCPDNNSEAAIERVITCFSEPLTHNNIAISFEPSAGILYCPKQADNYEDLIRRVSIALAEARNLALPSYTYKEGADEIHLRKLTITAHLQQAIQQGSFELLYQPQLDLQHNRVSGVEALIRWTDPVLGKVFPDEFIPLAEESGAISDITRWVLNQVCKDSVLLANTDFSLAVAINLSAKDILSGTMLTELLDKATNVAPKNIELGFEVTETALIADAHKAMDNLKMLQQAGLSLSMDDFGTGFSSLSQLKLMPVDKLKIDKSFVMKLDQSPEDQSIVQATIKMAHALGLQVVAEGVENKAAGEMLKAWGCDYMQGYYLARPMPLLELLPWLQQQAEYQPV